MYLLGDSRALVKRMSAEAPSLEATSFLGSSLGTLLSSRLQPRNAAIKWGVPLRAKIPVQQFLQLLHGKREPLPQFHGCLIGWINRDTRDLLVAFRKRLLRVCLA